MADRPSRSEAADEAGISFDDGKAFRSKLDHGGRAHVDRPLPFIVLNRFDKNDADSLARRVATLSSAYVVWPSNAECDQDALATIGAIAERLREGHRRILLLSVYDLPSDPSLDEEAPRLERFVFRLSATDDPSAQTAAHCLEQALQSLEVDLRHPKISDVSKAYFEPGIEALVGDGAAISHISLGVPQNYRVPGEEGIYPQLLHDLAIGIFDALLQGLHAFFADISPKAPSHHRALGRSSFIAAARTVDRKLDRISSAFDFLLSVSPINSVEAYEQFKASKYEASPVFHYRPLTVDPEIAKRRLYDIDLRRVEDPVLENLFAQKRRELDQQLTMLQSRNTPNFRYSSLMLYGAVESSLLESSEAILDEVELEEEPEGRREIVGAEAVQIAAEHLIGCYREDDPDFIAHTSLREDIGPGLMVSGRNLLISTATRMQRRRVDALLQHEVSIHLLTFINGDAQGLKIFRSGLAGYEGIQEGLGVFAECAVGGLTVKRFRLLAARVIIVAAMIDGADFIDCFRILSKEHGFGPRAAFGIVARVYRSGGLAKDAIYLRGLGTVLKMLSDGKDLTPFWFGKIAAHHIPIVEELELRGLLHRPRVTPAFLSRKDAQARIAEMRSLGSLAKLI